MNLDIIALEIPCDFRVTALNEVPHKLGTARLIIRADGICAAEGLVISVEKNYRNTHAYKLFVQIEIRVRHCGFCTLYQYAVNGILEYFFENSALVADAVAGRGKNRSMTRNLRHHLDLEKQEGISYTQWQAEQLAALADFRESTNTALGNYFKEFNERRLNAYIASVKSGMERTEYALMRMAEDQYRKAIFNAGVAYNTGAVTLPQAVDQATNDFLSRGLNCIEYRNVRRVNIDAYAEMAVRTLVTRPYLQGESAKRDEWGVNTVIVNRRGVACPKCLQYADRVFYDDVYGHVKPQKLNADFVEEHGDVLKRRMERETARDLRPRVPAPPELPENIREYGKPEGMLNAMRQSAEKDESAQFERYREILGDMAPDSLDKFMKSHQKMRHLNYN